MSMTATVLRKAGYTVSIAALVAFSGPARANTMGLTDTPLFLSAGAQPNLIMAIDDSGSMDFEVLFPGNDGSAWWRSGNSGGCGTTDNNSFTGCRSDAEGTTDVYAAGQLNFNNSGNSGDNWKKYSYLFPNGSGGNTSARRRLDDGTNDHFAIPPIPAYAWARSPRHNAAYFNPSATYLPWQNGGGFTFTNANPSATRFDPVFEATATIDLTRDFAGEGNVDTATACSALTTRRADHHQFKTYTGMVLPEGTCIRISNNDAGWQTVRNASATVLGCRVGVTNGCPTNDGTSDLDRTLASGALVAIRYFPATFWLPTTTALPTDYGFSGTPRAGGTAPDGTALVGYEIKRTNFDSDAHYNAAIQNFANWFQYYRKRHQALRGGLGEAFSDLGGIRVDGFTINNRNNSVVMGSIDSGTVKTELYRRFYSDWVRSGGTPNRTAVATLINNFRRTDADAPVTLSCQKNFGMLFTDGFSNSPANGDGIDGHARYGLNVDGDKGAPYSDTYAGSLADAVMYAYSTPLRSDAGFPSGRVSVPAACGTGTYRGPLDCNRNLHMNFYAVTLGTKGLLFNPDAPADPYSVAQPWPTNFPARHPSAVDDLWHATVNGRGQLLNARSSQEIADKLKAVLRSIVDRTSTAAAAALNSGSINSNSLVYQARFRSSDWTGELLSYRINPTDGQLIADSAAYASDLIPSPTSRSIFTRNSAGTAVPFTWTGNLADDVTRVQQLAPGTFATEAERLVEAQRMLNYLRGDDSNEGEGATQYRVRRDPSGPNKLGDIVNSAPLFVGAPPFRYRDSLESSPYSTFARDNASRPAMVYAGANDGMLHAFYADGTNRGREAFAYIPAAVFPRLRNLADKDYGHQFYVDGSPSMGDAYFAPGGGSGKSWRTVLTGGLNKGGQAIYALDVTNPATFGASSALWEFTDANDVDLGFTYSQPIVAKLRDGKWYVIFGNGYNSMHPDGRPSTTGNAVLFIVDLETGVATKIDTGVGYSARGTATYGNGLSTPTVIDVDRDRVIDYVYAGDLYGNMWKFDLSATSAASWTVAFGGRPLFTARNDAGGMQPITVRPEVIRGPEGNGQLVLFGTGKYLEAADKLLTPQVVQSFYGIVDRDSRVTYTGLRNTVLTQQTILNEVRVTKTDPAGNSITSLVRTSTNNTLGASQGWFMDLVAPVNVYQGEKQVTNPVVRDGKVIFTTLIPDADACGFGGKSWLMELEALDGSRPEVSPFDLNRDGQFTTDDNVPEGGGSSSNVPPSGLGSSEDGFGILQAPGVASGEFGETGRGTPVQYKYLPGSSGNIMVVIENPGIGGTGRQSWRQIR